MTPHTQRPSPSGAGRPDSRRFVPPRIWLGLALPLPIPGSNLIFIVPIVLYAIGLLEDDGLLIVLGHVGSVVNVTLVLLLWDAVARALRAVLSHLA